jgi:hypothetical protein
MRSASASAGFLVVSLCLSTTVAAQTVGDVVRRYVRARGGLARLRSVESLRLSGTMELPGISAPFVIELKRPNKMRTEITVEGRTSIRAYDGRTGWAQSPLPGEPPLRMSPQDTAEARAQADVDLSPLVDAAKKGYTVELAGRNRLLGGDAWTLVVRGSDGPPRTVFLDAKSHLVVRVEDRRTVDDQPVDFVTEVGDYHEVEGVVFPHRFEVGPKRSEERQRLVVQKVEVNPPLADERFAMPAPGPASRPASPSVLR